MANERFTDLPAVATAQLTDIICAVQGYVSPSNIGVSYQETLQQIYDLFQSNVILFNAGNPNGALAGKTYQLCWDTVDTILWVCTTTGSDLTAVWTKAIHLTAGSGITIEQSGSVISISADDTSITWNKVTTDTTMVSGNGYQINTGSNINLALPATSSFGDEINIMGYAGGLWTITQAAGQKVTIGSNSSTIGAGGSISATNQSDSVVLICMQDNLIWNCLGAPQGNLSII
jgi:uncharacterized cupin superfamily protein